jgi:hypothetical protein
MMKKQRLVKAILICPFEQTVTEVEHDANDYREIYKALSHPLHPVDCFTAVSISEQGDVIYVDDNGLLNNPKHFFIWRDYPQPLAGRGLILGTDAADGETVGTTLRLDYVRRMVMFTNELRVAGFEQLPTTKVNHPILGEVTKIGSRPLFLRMVDPADSEDS